ncbi:uncharacterized protein LOC128207290 [Mya arenaria]|uniref:uncharacterized protein LOC128207290 n=1 Tax=Mya arenaria TaxID=6604 RepID=UPI0022E3348D|nr:uncharacterized protein LOC128207290 [Mya arenaria]
MSTYYFHYQSDNVLSIMKIFSIYSFLFIYAATKAAIVLEGKTVQTIKGAKVTKVTSVLEGVSRIRCVDVCIHQNRAGNCRTAGYHKSSRTCYLSMHGKRDIVVVSDQTYSVMMIEDERGENVTQWANEVYDFSSEYTQTSWGAIQLRGEPDAFPNGYGDSGLAWCPSVTNRLEFLEVSFALAVEITGVDIYETWYGGRVTAVKCFENGGYVTLWSGTATGYVEYARIFSPPLNTNCFSDRIRIEIAASYNWVEIDAIRLHGFLERN